MGSADYIGLKADYALVTSAGGRRFGTIEVVFNNAQALITDNSTQDVGTNTSGHEFIAQGDPLELVFSAAGSGNANLAISFKLIAQP